MPDESVWRNILVDSVDVCVCTFRRPSLRLTLESLAQQRARTEREVRVVVADNDVGQHARAAIEALASELALPLTYDHAPEQNI